MGFVMLVMFFQCLQELNLRKAIGHKEDGVAVWALHVFATSVPRNGVWDVQSALTRLDCYRISCHYLLVWFVHWFLWP